MEVAQQTTTTPQAHPQEPQWDTGYGDGYSGHHGGGSYYPSNDYPEPSLRARTFVSASYTGWYAPLEQYISYGVDQTERTVEGIGRIERRMDDFAHMQTEMHDLFGHFGITFDA
jgi:hypothetical protein